LPASSFRKERICFHPEEGISLEALQRTLDIGWPVVQKEIDANTHLRVNWKQIFVTLEGKGMSVNELVSRLRQAGCNNAKLAYEIICMRHPQLTEEMKRRLLISICARYGESATQLKVKA